MQGSITTDPSQISPQMIKAEKREQGASSIITNANSLARKSALDAIAESNS
jgi:hypothetical protein